MGCWRNNMEVTITIHSGFSEPTMTKTEYIWNDLSCG